MKSFVSIVAIATLIVGVSACERASKIVQPATHETEDKSSEISIGVVLPLTGPLGATGKIMKQSFDLALEEINNAQISDTRLKFIIEDDTGTPEGAVTAFNTLIHQEGMSVILGPATSAATQAAFPIAQENQVVAISPTSSARGLSAIGDFVFRIPTATDAVVLKSVMATQGHFGYQRVATLYDDTDFFSEDLDAAWREAFTAEGIEVLPPETFQSGDTDFSPQLARIKALAPDALFVSALPPEKPGILIQAHALGISIPIVMSSLTGVEIQAAGDAAEGVITIGGWLNTDDTPGNQTFVQNYNAIYGMKPTAFAMASYTAVYVLAEAIQNAQSMDATAIRDALAALKDFDTVQGKFSFDANGDGNVHHIPNLVLIVKDGVLQRFE